MKTQIFKNTMEKTNVSKCMETFKNFKMFKEIMERFGIFKVFKQIMHWLENDPIQNHNVSYIFEILKLKTFHNPFENFGTKFQTSQKLWGSFRQIQFKKIMDLDVKKHKK